MYNTVVQLCQFFVVVGKFYYDRKKKCSSRLSGGLCCCVSFWFWREIGLQVHTTMYLEYHIVVVLCNFFWFWWEIVFGVTYVLSVQYSCAFVSFFLLWRESFITTGKKKNSSRLSGRCAIVITTGIKKF